ncbi:NAD+ synthase [Campylobacter sp. 9BO]|uniref:NAD+ synthase n=1 Tax=Campylobacter sp. 9BO TaxID=3424759 RepID=UPI003D338A61
MDFKSIKSNLVTFLQNAQKMTGAENLLLGVSGGLDSAVVATLCKLAAPQNTHALLMPTNSSNKQNLQDGLELCKTLDINHKIINIDEILTAYQSQIGENLGNLRKGNLCARIRMSLLYDYSANIDAIVVGTSNKSELMLGYGTIFGDLACAINPIGELYKSEIFEFARFLGISENIINKAPSADLWEDQNDEGDLGYNYGVLDGVLRQIDENKQNLSLLDEKVGDKDLLKSVLSRYHKNRFKAHMPIIAKL